MKSLHLNIVNYINPETKHCKHIQSNAVTEPSAIGTDIDKLAIYQTNSNMTNGRKECKN